MPVRHATARGRSRRDDAASRTKLPRTFCVFEQLDDIPGWILKQDLPPSSCLGNFTAEACSRFAQLVDRAVEILRHDHESTPPARLGITPCLPSAAGTRRVEKEVQILQFQRGELPWVVLLDSKTETVPIERDRFINVVHDVSNGCHVAISSAMDEGPHDMRRSGPPWQEL